MRSEAGSSIRARRERRERIRQAGIHAVLVVGCAIFAFPFVWLVTTSFKDEREIAIFPPRWVPQVPHYSTRSPFVDPAWYEAMRRPASIPPEAWREQRGPITRALDDCLGKACAAHARVIPDPGLTRDPAWRASLRNGMWEELSRILPDDVASDPARIPGFIATGIDADRLRKVATGLSRVLAVGDVTLRDARSDLIAAHDTVGRGGPSPWQVVGGRGRFDWPVEVEDERAPILRYDLSAGAVEVERVLRQGDLRSYQLTPAMAGQLRREAARRRGTGPPATPWGMDSVTLSLRSDGSWHRVFLDLETADAVYRSEEPFWLERSTWRDLEWRFFAPEDRTRPVVVLRRDPEARAAGLAPGVVRLRLRLERSSPVLAAYAKYSLNYRRALTYVPFWRFVGNSVYLVVLNILGQVLACSLVAYAFARLRFYGRDALFAVLLATMMLPGQVTMIPVFLIFKSLGWYNTMKPLWVGAWFGSAFFIFLLRQFFLSIPQDLEDAAKIDGCGFLGTYWRILLPLVRPALATVAIFTFMNTWNEFMGPLIYIGSENLTPLSLGLYMFRSEHGGEWGMMMAASTLMTLPVIIIFFFAQRYFIQGVTLTGMGGK